jgi:phage protein D
VPIPNTAKTLSPSFDVLLNGQALSEVQQSYVLDLTIDITVDLPSMFSLTVAGSSDQKEETPWVDDDVFSVGRTFEARLGYEDDLEALIKGEITGLEAEFPSDGRPKLTVRGFDRRHRLQRKTKTHAYLKMKDSAIADQIAANAGLKPDIEDSRVVHDYVLQANQTDLEFLQDRARRIQYEVTIDDKTLRFRPVSNAKSDIVTLTKEDDLLEFYPRLTSMQQVSKVTVQGWDPTQKAKIVAHAGKGDEQSRMGAEKSDTSQTPEAFGSQTRVITNEPVFTQAQADDLARSRFKNMSLSLITGDGLCLGRTDLKPGQVIKIDGVGKRFSGKYYLTSVTHRYAPQHGYHTRFEFERNAS